MKLIDTLFRATFPAEYPAAWFLFWNLKQLRGF
jgi:hypothetical protein